jgi:hypothetical protein
MNIVDQFHRVETVGDLKKALAEYDNSAKINALFSANGLGALSMKGSIWTPLYLRVRKVETSLGKSKPVHVVAGEVFQEGETKHVEPTLEQWKVLNLKDKLEFLAGRRDAKSMQGYMLGGGRIEVSKQEYGWILDKLSLDDFFNEDTHHSQN